MTPRRRVLGRAAALLALALLAAAALRVRPSLLAQDRCLDRGGMWDGTCVGARPDG